MKHQLSIIKNPKRQGKNYNKWLVDQAKPGHRELLRAVIDDALKKKPADLDTLLKLMQEDSCDVIRRG